MVRVGIVGATGYAGEELIKVLLNHPQARITYLAAKMDTAQNISEVFPHFKTRLELVCDNPDLKKAVELCDLIFLALPHTVSMEIAPVLLAKKKIVIDLSADYRLKDAQDYRKWYKLEHKDKVNLPSSTYGLPEIYRQDLKKARLVANPGCYPTAAILALAPIVVSGIADLNNVIIDAKSGVTGAGRKAAQEFFFSELNENFKAYKVNSHQHAQEINQELSNLAGKKIEVTFVPHLLPLNRGILETIYVRLSPKSLPVRQAGKTKNQKLIAFYTKFYKNEPFIRIKKQDQFPQIKDVVGTNFCDIGLRVNERKNQLIIIAAIDNLMKGAAGQAVQNMNIVCGFKETAGLL